MSDQASAAASDPDWRPIAIISPDARIAFALRAENGRIPTRARTVVEYVWDTDQLNVAVDAIATTIEKHFNAKAHATLQVTLALARMMVPVYGANLDDTFREALQAVISRPPTTAEMRAAESIRERCMLDVDLVPRIRSDLDIPAHKWAPELLEHVDWSRSEHLWRVGPPNRRGHKQGYDIEGIEFDYLATKSLGGLIKGEAEAGTDLNHSHPREPWLAGQMTEAITEYCQRTKSGDCGRAWREHFKAMQPITGWTNTDFRNHWSEARKTKGQPGRQSSARSKCLKSAD